MSMYYSTLYDSEELDLQFAVKKSKIGHLGLLAETCLKYSYEFNLIIHSADSYSSSLFTLKKDSPSKKWSKSHKNSDENYSDAKKRDELRKKLKKERTIKRLDKKIEEIKRKQEQEEFESDLISEIETFPQLATSSYTKSEPKLEKSHYKIKSQLSSTKSSKYQPYQSHKSELKIKNFQNFSPNELLNFYENNTGNEYSSELFLNSSNVPLSSSQKDYYRYLKDDISLSTNLINNNKRKLSDSLHFVSPFNESPFVEVGDNYFNDQKSKNSFFSSTIRKSSDKKQLHEGHHLSPKNKQKVKKDPEIPFRLPVN